MLVKALEAVVGAFLRFIAGQAERSRTAADASGDRGLLRRAGRRIRDRMRANGVRPRIDTDADGADGQGPRVFEDR